MKWTILSTTTGSSNVLEDGRCFKLKTLLRARTGFTRLASQPARLEAMDKSLGTPLNFAAKRLASGELLIVASNGPGKKAPAAYRRRWQIECLFGDSKTRGLNMEDTAMTNLEKLSLLIAVVTLAMVWSYACARQELGRRSIAKANHGYLRKSWFRTGFDLLRNWILHQPDKAADIWIKLWPIRKNSLEFARVVMVWTPLPTASQCASMAVSLTCQTRRERP